MKTKKMLKKTKRILDYNKDVQQNFQLESKVDKKKSWLKFEKIIAERTKLRKRRIAEIEEEEKKYTTNCLIVTLVNIKIQVICIKNYVRQKAT